MKVKNGPKTGVPESLHSIATKDVATPEIQQSLLSAEELGQSKLDTFVEERLVNSTVKFRDRMQKSNPLTFKSLYKVSNRDAKGKVTILKADRTILQQLATAFQAGRKVDLHHVLQHELMNIPISIANCDGSLRTGSKAILADHQRWCLSSRSQGWPVEFLPYRRWPSSSCKEACWST